MAKLATFPCSRQNMRSSDIRGDYMFVSKLTASKQKQTRNNQEMLRKLGLGKLGKTRIIYLYNSVRPRRCAHINSSASAPLNATKIAVMKVSDVEVVRVRPELLFLIYKCCFFTCFCAR